MAQIKRSGTCTSTVVFKMFCICAFLSLKGCNKRPIEFTGNVIVKKKNKLKTILRVLQNGSTSKDTYHQAYIRVDWDQSPRTTCWQERTDSCKLFYVSTSVLRMHMPTHPHTSMYTFKDAIVLKSSLMFRKYVCGKGEKVRKINGQYFRTQTKFRHNFKWTNRSHNLFVILPYLFFLFVNFIHA